MSCLTSTAARPSTGPIAGLAYVFPYCNVTHCNTELVVCEIGKLIYIEGGGHLAPLKATVLR